MKWINSIMVIALAFVLALVPVDDYDVWWHLKCGQLFLETGRILREDIFSYTAFGAKWVDGYLPAQVLLWLSWRIGGADGLCLLGASLVAATFIFALIVAGRGRGYTAALALALPAILFARDVMLPRPALLVPIFSLLALWFLENHRRHGGKRIWLLVPLTALWANCHPSFFLGPCISGIYYFGGFIQQKFTKIFNNNNKQAEFNAIPLAVIALQFPATLINPYGHLIYYPLISIFSNPELKNAITEWNPLYVGMASMPDSVVAFLIIAVAGIAAFVWNRRSFRIEHLLLFVFIALATIFSRRNALLLGACAIPIVAWTINAGTKIKNDGKLLKKRLSLSLIGNVSVLCLGAALIWFAATDRLYLYTNTMRTTGVGVQTLTFPEKAAGLLKRERIQGNIFHTYEMGGYLIFKLYPEYRVYIDGRIYPYPFRVYARGITALRSVTAFQQIVIQYDLRAVLLTLQDGDTWPLVAALLNSQQWATVSAEDAGILFLRRGAGNDEIIARHEINPLAMPPELSLAKIKRDLCVFEKVEYPYSSVWWAEFYKQMGRADLAEKVMDSE